ncbi:glycosyltransferase family 4 protein [Agromyces bauzanensis]|uniref:D-inositol 3-phosphate glycosyltransferase n=1 Tax=Agromyces bauzanensis TaxID=1308924 RepID=A0A917PT08_9MICO|nr:glycosyltransferase family 4 protein [Agromyces bauzanensis]GGJ90565.1 glycosyl transferase [Agromyces bauzanensis]
MTRSLRILHAIRSDGFSGVERFVVRLARQQRSDGHQVAVIGGATDPMRRALDPIGVAHITAARTHEVARAVRRLASGFDVINTHMTAAELGAAVGLAGRLRRPAVVATRHFAKPHGRVGPIPVGLLVRPFIDAQLSISRAVASAIDGPSTVVHSGVESRPLHDGLLRGRTVLMAQRLQPEKHGHIGIRAFAAAGLAEAGWKLEIAGQGPEQAALEALTQELGIGHAVRFFGYRADLPEIMDLAGLLLAPCPVEGLGLTVLEAMAGGLPVVAAGAAGHLDVFEGLEDRCLFDPDDVEHAAARLRRLADDDAGRSALGVVVHSVQQRRFSLAAQAAGTERVYRSVLR